MSDKLLNTVQEMHCSLEANGIMLDLMSSSPDFYAYAHRRKEFPIKELHTHSWYELFYVTEGAIHIFFEDGTRISAKKGEMIFVAPGVEHFSQIDTNEGASRYSFAFFYQQKKATALSRSLNAFFNNALCLCLCGTDLGLSDHFANQNTKQNTNYQCCYTDNNCDP